MTKSKNRNGKNKKSKERAGHQSANLRYAKPTPNGRGAINATNKVRGDVVHTCSITDPWCPHATGAKLPDSDSSRSVPITLKFMLPASTDANGAFAKTISPSLAAHFTGSTTITGGAVTVWGAATSVSDYAAIAAEFASYRIVSMGVRVYSVLAPTAQSGFIRFITNPHPVTGAAYTYTGGLHESLSQYATAGCDAHWVAKPVGADYLTYVDIAARPSWDELIVIGEGLPASTSGACQFEVVMHLECQIDIGGIGSLIASPAALSKPRILAASGAVHNAIGGVINDTTEAVTTKISKMAKNAVSEVAADILPFLKGAALAMF